MCRASGEGEEEEVRKGEERGRHGLWADNRRRSRYRPQALVEGGRGGRRMEEKENDSRGKRKRNGRGKEKMRLIDPDGGEYGGSLLSVRGGRERGWQRHRQARASGRRGEEIVLGPRGLSMQAYPASPLGLVVSHTL